MGGEERKKDKKESKKTKEKVRGRIKENLRGREREAEGERKGGKLLRGLATERSKRNKRFEENPSLLESAVKSRFLLEQKTLLWGG